MLSAIENSQFAEWFLISMWGFPTFIALHSVGMAFVVGISLVVALWQYGFIGTLAAQSMKSLYQIAWYGFLLNLVTGLALVASRISEYLVDLTFLVKIGFVFVAVALLKLTQRRTFVLPNAEDSEIQVLAKPVFADRCMGLALVFVWVAAITAGRWIAYLSGLYR